MLILGVGGLLHDPAAALLEDGRIRCAIESEKVTRHHKEVSIVPVEAIECVVRSSGISLADVDLLVTNWDPRPHRHLFYLPNIARYCRHGVPPWRHVALLMGLSGALSRSNFELHLRAPRVPPLSYIRHHLAHVGLSYTLSPFDRAAVAIFDGAGEYDSTSLFQCEGRKVRKLWSCGLPFDSLGTVFAMGTQHLGFRMLGDEYKVMALAALGERNERFEQFFARLLRIEPEGRYRIDGRLLGDFLSHSYYFPPSTYNLIGTPRVNGNPMQPAHYDFARAMQQRIGDVVIHVLRYFRKASGMTRLCLGGGLVLNSVINGRIAEEGIFEELFVPPAPHDAGTVLGAAAYQVFHLSGLPRPAPLEHAYWGPAYSNEAVRAALENAGASFEELSDVPGSSARLLAEGAVIGWFQGPAEFGPRALGNRSILADPGRPENRARVSEVIKGREGFRPLAPAILEEFMGEYFPGLPASPFMSYVGTVPEALAGRIPAAVHFDRSARPQTICRRTNPLFHELVHVFHGLTGIPAVINTSFNVSGEPIVLTPNDAIRTFFSSGLDALVIDRFLVRKRQERR